MRIQVLLFVKCGTELAVASAGPPWRPGTSDIYTLVDSAWKDIEPVSLLKPLGSPDEMNPTPGTHFELIEVWADPPQDISKQSQGTEKRLYVHMYNLYPVRRLLSHRTNLDFEVDFVVSSEDKANALTGDTLLAIEKLIKAGATVTYRTPWGGTLAHFAASVGSTALIAILGKCGADLNAARRDSELPIHVALKNGNDTILALLDNGADVNGKEKRGYTLLHYAALKEETDLGAALVERGADVNAKSLYDWTPLHCAAGSGRTEMVEFLLENGAVIDAKGASSDKTDDELTPLHAAIKNGWLETAKLLIYKGADCQIVCNQGHNALYHALNHILRDDEPSIAEDLKYVMICIQGAPYYAWTHRQSVSVLDLILNRNVDVDNPGNKAAFELILSRSKKIPFLLEKLIVYGFSVPAEHLTDVLFIAIYFNSCKTVEKLLICGADVNEEREFRLCGDGKATPLRVACRSMWTGLEIIQMLLDHGADPATSHELMTLADENCNEGITKLLLDRLFSVRFMSKSGERDPDCHELRELLKKSCLGHFDSDESSSSGSERSHSSEDDDSFLIIPTTQRRARRSMLASHILKLQAAGKKAGEDFDPTLLDWGFLQLPNERRRSATYLQKCEREIDILKLRTVSGTNVELFELLNMSIDRLARLLRNGTIRSELLNFNSDGHFPYYGNVIEARIRRATCRRQHILVGLQAFNRLVIRLPALPIEVKEYIVMFLANHECARLSSCFKKI